MWLNTTHMHLFTHTKPESKGQAGRWQSPYHDTMIDHDKNVGEMLDLLDELGIADDTFVMYSTDNGPHRNTWPDGGMTPFRSEKNTNWEGAFRVPLLVRWPGQIEAGSVANGIVQHHDWLPTFLAMAGDPDVVDKLKKGYQAIGRTYKNHIDGFNLLPYLTGEAKESPRNFFFYFSDDGDVLGIRFDNWKIVFMEQRTRGTMAVWAEPFTPLRLPKIFNLRTDPYEFADITSNTYLRLVPAQRLLHLRGAGGGGEVRGDLQGVPAVQKPEQLHHRRRHGEDDRGRERRQPLRSILSGTARDAHRPRHLSQVRAPTRRIAGQTHRRKTSAASECVGKFAPCRVHVMDEAATAYPRASLSSGMVKFRKCALASRSIVDRYASAAAWKVSPAPTVSTTATSRPATKRRSWPRR